ncbi:MAG TPA: DUF1385 domain-containing protein [Fimbriimonas sp.]|nr:DUF1385 domain-containing protein [Fimbriimonas sp.]
MPKGEYLQYGGQAIIEGVMMRSPRYFSVACRAPNGEIVVQTEEIEKTWIGRQKWLKTPFLRGSLALLDAMALGMRAMRFASNVQLDPARQAEGSEPVPVKTEAAAAKEQKIQDGAIGLTIVFSLIFGLFLFNYVPNLVAEFSHKALHTTDPRQTNFIAEIAKFAIFLGYIWAIGQLKDVKEVFKYHGAEHKAINTLEHEKPLVFEECLKQSRLHPRCGTSFAIIVLLVGLLVFTFVPRYPLSGNNPGQFPIWDVTVRFMIELAILPFIAGASYELLRLAGRFRNQGLVNAFFKPGIWTQYLTTREPDEKQIEVALVALKAVLAEEEKDQAPTLEANAIESAPVVVP